MKTCPMLLGLCLLYGYQGVSTAAETITNTSSESTTSDPVGADQVQDMSDPLAVYTQAGFGFSNKGLNLKIGQTFDTGSDIQVGMTIIEIRGFFGEVFGWDSGRVTSDSIDSVRFRQFTANTTNGRGAQIDVNYNFRADSGGFSYSFLQGLPTMGRLSLYPLGGLGVTVANNAIEDDGSVDSGFSIPGALGLIGMYAKFAANDKIWFNYNPTWSTAIQGSERYKNTGFGGRSNLLAHEFAASYQINPRFNARYFANWNEELNFGEGDHRIEFNYQL